MEQHERAFKEKPMFLPWEKAVAFQAADFAGWKIRKNVTSALAPDHTIQKGMRLLDSVKMLASIPKDAGVLNYETLQNTASRGRCQEGPRKPAGDATKRG